MYGIVFLRDISFFQVKEIIYEQNLQTCLEQSKKHLGGDFRNRQRTWKGLLVGKQEEKSENSGHGGFFGGGGLPAQARGTHLRHFRSGPTPLRKERTPLLPVKILSP